jgi:putative two-component system response regulator
MSKHSVLIVDDEPLIRRLCRYALEFEGIDCDEAADGLLALEAMHASTERSREASLPAGYDLVLLDIDMPRLKGPEVCRRLRAEGAVAHLKIIMMSGRASADDMAQMLSGGADDYLSKPLSVVQLQARVKAALRLRDAQGRSDLLNRNLLVVNAELERNLGARDSDLVQARNALVLALAKLVEFRDSETGAHLMRLQRYSRCLAEEVRATSGLVELIDPTFVDMLECCAPLHDIGKVGLPDHILLKPGKLDPDERIIMQAHTIIGAETLQTVARQHGFALAFLQMASDIARHHHERYDGRGYPDRLVGSGIPLAARLVALGDVYDALRARRPYKPALTHLATLQLMESNVGQFDPLLQQAFERCSSRFEEIFKELGD